MAMVANDPAAAKRLGIPSKVGKEFMEADKGRKFSKGGDMKKMSTGGSAKPTPMGKVKTAAPSRDGVVIKGHTKGKQVKMAGSSKGMKKGGKC